MKKLRAAVIGVGYLGTFHAQKLAAHPLCDLVAVYDQNPQQAQKVAADLAGQLPAGKLATQAIANLEQLIGAVDFVTIAAATQAHYELAHFFLTNKIAVLVEKPIAATAELGKKLAQLARENKTTFSVGHIERFNPAYDFLKQHATQIKYLELNRLAPFRVRGSDVSVLHDLMIHDIDLVNYIFKQKIKNYIITGHSLIRPTIDDVSVRLELESGTQINIQNSRLCPQIIRNYRVVLNDRTLLMNTATLEGEFLFADSHHESCMRTEKIQVTKVDALALEIDHFIQAVLGKKSVAITADEATFALEQVEQFVKDIQA